ncbi:double zinc ribbon domain-containing protein, partial [Bacillus spizizenii]|uniref:double zinc ribbon domain-containing protein n=1 Tax=Bacillus spizizenii TaxID=96241 RepID=UPI00284D7602
PEENVCHTCRIKLKNITGPICTLCGRPQSVHSVCKDCAAWKSSVSDSFLLRQNRSVYTYNDVLKETL